MIINGSHIHIYVENYDMKWAMPAEARGFIHATNKDTLIENLHRFRQFCNISHDLIIQEGLV